MAVAHSNGNIALKPGHWSIRSPVNVWIYLPAGLRTVQNCKYTNAMGCGPNIGRCQTDPHLQVVRIFTYP